MGRGRLSASVRFNINDSWRGVYPPFIRDLIARGAKIDVVGLQMHLLVLQPVLDLAAGKDRHNNTSWAPADVIRYLEELTPPRTADPSGRNHNPRARRGRAPMQAELTRDMYRLWFSWQHLQDYLVEYGG